MSTVANEYTQDGPEAVQIASVIPYYPFHGEYNVRRYISKRSVTDGLSYFV